MHYLESIAEHIKASLSKKNQCAVTIPRKRQILMNAQKNYDFYEGPRNALTGKS